MKVTVVLLLCTILSLHYELVSSQPAARKDTPSSAENRDEIKPRQSYPNEDDYYDEEEDEEQEDELQQTLNEQYYDGGVGGQGEGYEGKEPEEEDDNGEDEDDEEGEYRDVERFMENSEFLTNIFNILE